MFTILLDRQTDILQRLLNMYMEREPNTAYIKENVVDVTFGSGSLWKKIKGYNIIKCDREPNTEDIIKKDLMIDDYKDLPKVKLTVFDPPYLIGRSAYDYSGKVKKDGEVIPSAYQGKNSWKQKGGVKKYVANPTIEHFNERIKMANEKIPQFLEEGGYLFVKVMDIRHKTELITHHVTVINALTNFKLQSVFIYIKQGSTTWTVTKNGQTLHGYWLVFKRKKETS